MHLDFLYTRHTANCKTFVNAAVVNIIIEFFQTVKNCSMKYNKKQQNKHLQSPSAIQNRTKTCTRFHVAIYFYDDMSKKTYQYKRYGMKWPIVLQIYIAWPLPPSFFTSLLTSSSQWVHLTCPEARVLLNVPPGYFSFAFHYTDTSATQLFPQQAATHTHSHFCLLQFDIDRYPSPLSLNLH